MSRRYAARDNECVGRVSFYCSWSGYGFVDSEVGRVFVHRRQMRNAIRLEVDQPVVFNLNYGARGPYATDLWTIDNSSDSSAATSASTDERAKVLSSVATDDDTGYDTDRFKDANHEHFICNICQGVHRNPVLTKCQHLFCRTCLEKWIDRKPECPIDRQPLTKDDLSDLRCLKDLYNNLKLECVYAEVGCSSIVTIEQLPEHESSCSFKNRHSELSADKSSALEFTNDKSTCTVPLLTKSKSTMTDISKQRTKHKSTLTAVPTSTVSTATSNSLMNNCQCSRKTQRSKSISTISWKTKTKSTNTISKTLSTSTSTSDFPFLIPTPPHLSLVKPLRRMCDLVSVSTQTPRLYYHLMRYTPSDADEIATRTIFMFLCVCLLVLSDIMSSLYRTCSS